MQLEGLQGYSTSDIFTVVEFQEKYSYWSRYAWRFKGLARKMVMAADLGARQSICFLLPRHSLTALFLTSIASLVGAVLGGVRAALGRPVISNAARGSESDKGGRKEG
jgi:hypothetical protein